MTDFDDPALLEDEEPEPSEERKRAVRVGNNTSATLSWTTTEFAVTAWQEKPVPRLRKTFATVRDFACRIRSTWGGPSRWPGSRGGWSCCWGITRNFW